MDIKLIKRDIFNELKNHLNKKEISLIVGPRQVGKTTIMFALKGYLESKKLKTLFLSLDFENDKKFFSSQENLINKLSLEFGDEKGYVFLDEIQRKENAGLFLKGIYDKNLPHKFIISGSGSVELKEKVHESLAGRKLMFEMRPVSFFEFVNFKTDYRYEDKLDDYFSLEYERGINFLEEYMNFGGYPRVILEKTLEDKIKIIDEIYKSYIEKDISYLLKVEKLDVFSSLLKILASQTGKLLNYSELSNTMGVSLQTVKNYIWYMENTFILERLSPFFRNLRKEITKSPVVYFYDLGLRNYMLGRFGQISSQNEFGFLFQNLMFNKLKESTRFSGITINFWRTKEKAEVDFIINKGEEVIPVEVKYKELKNFAIGRSLRSFVEKYNPKTAILINKRLQHKLSVGSAEIEFIPYFKLKKFLNK